MHLYSLNFILVAWVNRQVFLQAQFMSVLESHLGVKLSAIQGGGIAACDDLYG